MDVISFINIKIPNSFGFLKDVGWRINVIIRVPTMFTLLLSTWFITWLIGCRLRSDPVMSLSPVISSLHVRVSIRSYSRVCSKLSLSSSTKEGGSMNRSMLPFIFIYFCVIYTVFLSVLYKCMFKKNSNFFLLFYSFWWKFYSRWSLYCSCCFCTFHLSFKKLLTTVMSEAQNQFCLYCLFFVLEEQPESKGNNRWNLRV